MKDLFVICDKDGTLAESASGNIFVQNPTDQRLLSGVADRIIELSELATFVICSNQGGVAANHKSLEDAIAEMKFCMNLIGEATEGKGEIDYAYFCPDFKGMECWAVHPTLQYHLAEVPELNGTYRKPGAGMLHFAQRHYEWRFRSLPSQVIMIGDRPEDAEAAASAGIPFVDAEAWRSGAVKILPTGFIA